MPAPLPSYEPPAGQRAALAAAAAPVSVLLTFMFIVIGAIQADTGFAAFAASTAWVVYEMHDFQKHIDVYNQAYVDAHLAWRPSAWLQESITHPALPPATREFVSRFLAAERVLLRDGQLP
jgi:hypothetical protein